MHNSSKDLARVGIIDIGSNSVRMVVYHAAHRVPLPLYNEKYFCGLGATLKHDNRLDENGKAKARHALQRFALMAERMRLQQLTVLATAAVRDAEDGDAFRSEIETLLGCPVTVISGEEEARLAALGIIASFATPEGIVVDLGGGSMELALLKQGQITQQCSTPLGVLRLPADEGDISMLLAEHLPANLPRQMRLYAIGGSFRALAKMHMRQTNYPLRLLHGYRLGQKSVHRIAQQFAELPIDTIAELPGIPKRRAAAMPGASALLQQLMQHFGSEEVVFSVSGIREGYLYDHLTDTQKTEDPLLASAHDLALFAERHGQYAREVFSWTAPLFSHMHPRWERLRHAACILSEIAWRIDPNFRAEWLYNRILQSSLKGMSHRERVMLSLALYHRHQSKWKHETGPLALIDERERLWARAVGLSLRLAAEITGGASGHLHHAGIGWQDNQLALSLDEASQPLRSATAEKCLDGLGDTLSALSSLSI